MINISKTGWLVLFIAVLTISPWFRNAVIRPAWAAMMVLDQSNLVKNAETATSLANLLSTQNSALTQLQDLFKGIGEAKAQGNNSSVGKILSGTGLNDVLGQSARQAGITLDTSVLSGGLGSIPGAPGAGFGDFNEALRFMRKVMRATKSMTSGQRRLLEQKRLSFSNSSAEDVLAASAVNRQTAAEGNQQIRKIASAASSAENIQEKLTVLISAVLLQVQETQLLRGLVSTMAQLQAANYMSTRPAAYVAVPTKASGKGNPKRPAGDIFTEPGKGSKPWINPDKGGIF